MINNQQQQLQPTPTAIIIAKKLKTVNARLQRSPWCFYKMPMLKRIALFNWQTQK